MGKKKYIVCVLSILFICTSLKISAQENIQATTEEEATFVWQLKESDLNKITDIRTQFKKQNSGYSRPMPPGKSRLQFAPKGKLEMSDEAKQIINSSGNIVYFDEHITFKDTIIVSPLFLPLVQKGRILPKVLPFENIDILPEEPRSPYDNPVPQEEIFKQEIRRLEFERSAIDYITQHHPTLFKYSEKDLPKEVIVPVEIKKELRENMPVLTEKEIKPSVNVDEMEAPIKFIPERMYWKSNFESLIQFSQNHFSDNWHKGGTSNLYLLTRHIVNYNYSKDKVVFNNTMDVKIGFNNAPNDTLRKHRVADNTLRVYSSLGYQAFNKKWHYTVNGDFNTQMFKSYAENTKNLQVAFLAPYTATLGVGMTYSFYKQFDQHQKLSFKITMDPVSLTYRKTINKDINMGAHGFQRIPDTDEFKTHYTNFGSTVRVENIVFQINKNVTWSSRILYTTNYERATAEFENNIKFILSRFLSANLFLYSRYDDGVAKREGSDTYFQFNESLTIGFNYKW